MRATSFKALGKAGATAGCALAGATTSGAPTAPAGPFDVGDMVVGQNGTLWICSTAGTSQSSPGSFTQVGGATSPLTTKGDVWVYGSADSRLGVGSDNQVLTADSTQSLGLKWAVTSANAGGALTQIAQTVLSSTAASITFSSIPGTYSTLEITLQARGDNASETNLLIQLNADTGANYAYQDLSGAGSTAGATLSTGQTSLLLANVVPSGAPAGYAAVHDLTFVNYAGTTFNKQVLATSYWAVSTARQPVQMGGGMWLSTAAITSIKLFPTSGNFIAGSVATLYGRS